MSTNCIKCVKNERTGDDLLCDECRGPRNWVVGFGNGIGAGVDDSYGNGCYISDGNKKAGYPGYEIVRGGELADYYPHGVLLVEHAELIVRAVNNLDDLLACARGYLNMLEGMERTDANNDAKAFVEKTIKAAEGRVS